VRDLVAVTALQSLLDSRGVDFDSEKNRAVHCRGERLRAAHSAETAGKHEFPVEGSIEMLAPSGSKSFECSLHNPLAADVDP
jgi:hypothetical protein